MSRFLRQRVLRRDQRRGDGKNDQKQDETARADDFGIARQPGRNRRRLRAGVRRDRLLVTSVPLVPVPAQACRSLGLSVATMRSTPMLIRMKINPNSKHQALDQREIAIDDGIDRQIADAGIGEDALDDHGAADQEGELNAGERQRRADRVAQRLLQHQAKLRNP
jgi:hypothetical protein